MDKVYCINCGGDMVDSNYNYETANTDYECQECGETFTHKDIPCEDLDYSTNPLSYFEDLID